MSVQATDSAIAAAVAAQARIATDLLCPMYSRIEDAVKLANVYPDLPLVLSEYSHMMGNSGGSPERLLGCLQASTLAYRADLSGIGLIKVSPLLTHKTA